MAITNRLVKAAEALELGLIDELVEPNILEDTALEFAVEIAALAPMSVRASMQAIWSPCNAAPESSVITKGYRQQVLKESEDFKIAQKSIWRLHPLFKCNS